MRFMDEFKRMLTVAFWKEVRYWSSIKWSGKLSQPISSVDWLPIMTSIVVGIILLLVIVIVLRLIF